MLEVVGENANGLLVGAGLALCGEFGFDARFQQSFVGIAHSRLHIRFGRCAAFDVGAYQACGGIVLVGGRDAHAEHPFGLAAAHGQQAVSGASLQGFRPVEVVAELQSVAFVLTLHHAAADDGVEAEGGAQCLACSLVLAGLFGNDVCGPLQGLVHVGHLVVEVFSGLLQGVVPWFAQHHFSQGLQSLFACHLCPGATFRLEGEVDVLDFRGVPGVFDALLQFGGEFSLPVDGFDDVFLAVLQFRKPLQLVGDGGDFHLVEVSRRLLAVAADEGYGGTVLEECHRVFHLRLAELQTLGDKGVYGHRGNAMENAEERK